MSAVLTDTAPAFAVGQWVQTAPNCIWQIDYVGDVFPEGRLYALKREGLRINAYENELTACDAPEGLAPWLVRVPDVEPERMTLSAIAETLRPTVLSGLDAEYARFAEWARGQNIQPIPGSYFIERSAERDHPNLVHIHQRCEHDRQAWCMVCDEDDAHRFMMALALLDAVRSMSKGGAA